eukprot:6553070-Prymnesium_polylepis.1
MAALPSSALSVREQILTGLLPLYSLLPAYYNEADEYAVYLAAGVVHEQLRLRVDGAGRLVDQAGELLARERDAEAIFVMDREGCLSLTFEWCSTYGAMVHSAGGAPRYHHSSM